MSADKSADASAEALCIIILFYSGYNDMTTLFWFLFFPTVIRFLVAITMTKVDSIAMAMGNKNKMSQNQSINLIISHWI